jgi:hypothetical protein
LLEEGLGADFFNSFLSGASTFLALAGAAAIFFSAFLVGPGFFLSLLD